MIKSKYLLFAVPLLLLAVLAFAMPGRGMPPRRVYLPILRGGAGPALRVVEARIVGSEGDRQTAYRPGEPVYLYVTFSSTADRDGRAAWSVDSPAGRVWDEPGPATFSAGTWEVYNEFMIPLDAMPGAWTFSYLAAPGGECRECSISVAFEVVP